MEPDPPTAKIADSLGGPTAEGLFDLAGGGVSDPNLPEQAGERIGPYKLREQIGEGGFGSVWVADQETPLQRRVALKIIKLGMDTREVVARFEQERQALALMDHPNIAKVLDAGATQWGRPYFVMELVRGIKITDYCDQAKLPTAERLKLFVAVCQAVQHAHQKGIIHRDLKPSNILVTLHDGVPVPKVIDFGIAKATQGRLTDKTVYTQFKHLIGTPLYMSPEQAEMSGLDIDTRSDIYALGVLLYELLTGRTPFDPVELMKRGVDEICRTIREQEPPRPSTALSTLADEAMTVVAQHRQSDSAQLIRLLRGDLDWVVMKALEKNRERRYETANAFAGDIQRYLASKPVVARPPSQAYLLQKFVRRNKLVFAASAAVAVALLAGLAASTWEAVRANREAERARAAEQMANQRVIEVAAERERARAAELVAEKRVIEVAAERERARAAEQMAEKRVIGVAAESDAKEKARQEEEAQRAAPAKSGELKKKRQDLLKAAVAEADDLKKRGDRHQALEAYLRIAKDYPESPVGKYRIDEMLNELRNRPSPITFEEFQGLRAQIFECAQMDSISAMLLLGDNLRTREPQTAAYWFSVAAGTFSVAEGKDNPIGLVNYGQMLRKGLGVDKIDPEKAAAVFQKAADQGDIAGKYELGLCYFFGQGVVADQKHGVELLREAADAGDSRAMNELGFAYSRGLGVARNYSMAFQWFSKSDERGNLEATVNLGTLYAMGWGVVPNPPKGAQLFEKSANAGNATGMFYYARVLWEGVGVPPNHPLATNWYKKAAAAGNSGAIGWCKEHQIPVPVDH